MFGDWSDIKGFVLFAAILIFVLVADVCCVSWYYNHIQNFLEEQPHPETADAGIIFFGDYLDKGTVLGPDSKNRALAAINLYKAKTIRHIIQVGGYDYRKWQGKPNLMSIFLKQNGIPANCITYDSLSYNTITNWEQAQNIIHQKRFDTLIAISAPLHIYRISHMIEEEGVYFASYQYDPNRFKDYWQIFVDTHHEWVSFFLSFALRDEVRNKVVYFVRTVMQEIKEVL